MNYYWVRFKDRSPGTIEASTPGDAMIIGHLCGAPIEVDVIPYPASPVISKTCSCPPFCYDPKRCAGCTACPKNPACSE